MSADTSLRGRLALDSGVLVEIFNNSKIGGAVFDALQDAQVSAFASWVNLAEASYVVCRKVGHEKALTAREDLVASGFINVVEDPRIHARASEFKCQRAISLADCYTFAAAAVSGSVPLFAGEEAELTREMKRKPFDPQPVFLSRD